VDDDNNNRRDAIMSNVRSAARSDGPPSAYPGSNVISSPPQAYSSNVTSSGHRYPASYNHNQQAVSAFDSIDRRTDIGNMYVPMQPDQFQSYPMGPPPSSARHVPPPTQAIPPSFYAASVLPSGLNSSQTRNPFQQDGTPQGVTGSKETRRGNGNIDTWQR